MTNWKRPLQLSITAAALLLAGQASRAEVIYGIGTAGTNPAALNLFSFDSATPGTFASSVAISGVTVGTLAGIDFRPATGQLYALSYDPNGTVSGIQGVGQLYTLNLSSGVASGVGSTFAIGAANNGNGSDSFGFGFNPTVDRIRVINGNGSNFRLNPNDGSVVDGNPNQAGTQFDGPVQYTANDPGSIPQISGAAYLGGRLFDIDVANNYLAEQTNPNGGALSGVGPLGLSTSGPGTMGFSISGATGTAFLSTDTGDAGVQDDLYTVDLTSGAATLVGAIGAANFNTYDISVFAVPEPSTWALCGVGLGVLGVVAWRRSRSAQAAWAPGV